MKKMSVSKITQRNDPEKALSPEPGPVHQMFSSLYFGVEPRPYMGWARESLGTQTGQLCLLVQDSPILVFVYWVTVNPTAIFIFLTTFSVAVSGSAIFDLDSANFSRPGTAGEGRPSSRCSRSVGRVCEAFLSFIAAYQNQRNLVIFVAFTERYLLFSTKECRNKLVFLRARLNSISTRSSFCSWFLVFRLVF